MAASLAALQADMADALPAALAAMHWSAKLAVEA